MPPDRQRDEDNGRFESEYSGNQILDIVRQLEPTTTGEVANELDCHRNTARRKLNDLAERGEVTKTERSGAYLWQSN